jgi:hypothetical protein
MAAIVIVTQQCYLLCEAINYIAINEVDENEERKLSIFENSKKKGKKLTKKQRETLAKQQYQIIIDFVPANGVTLNQNSRNNTNTATVAIRVTGRDKCLGLFSHMVEQIREQIPDNKFLDEIVNKFLQEEK